MLCVYYSENSGIAKEQVDKYIKFNKGKEMTDMQLVNSAMLSQFNSVAFFIGSADAEAVERILSSKLKRDVCVISKDRAVVDLVSSKVVKVYLLDDTTECMVDVWTSPIVSYDNVRLLESVGKRPVYYKFSLVKDSFLKMSDVMEEEVEGKPMYYIEINNLSSADSVKALKKEIAAQEKKIKAILSNKKSENTKAFVQLKNNGVQLKKSVTVYKDIPEYIIKNKYANEKQMVEAKELCKRNTAKKYTIEKALCELGVFSKEDLVVLLRGFLNEQVVGMSELESYVIEYIKVSDKLRKSGVIEVYAQDDNNRKNTILVMPYTLRDELKETINKTINYSKVVLTLPEYVEVFNGEFTY